MNLSHGIAFKVPPIGETKKNLKITLCTLCNRNYMKEYYLWTQTLLPLKTQSRYSR
jgi:hypothetical protein